MGEGLRFGELLGHEPRAERALGGDQFDIGGGQVALIHLVGEGERRGDDLQADALGGEGRILSGGRVPHLERGVGIVGLGHDPEGERRMDHRLATGQQLLRHDVDIVELCVGGVDEGQFTEAEALGEIPGLTLVEPQGELLLPEAAEQFADEQHDQAEMREGDAGFAPLESEAGKVGGDQVEQEQHADEIAAGVDRHRNISAG